MTEGKGGGTTCASPRSQGIKPELFTVPFPCCSPGGVSTRVYVAVCSLLLSGEGVQRLMKTGEGRGVEGEVGVRVGTRKELVEGKENEEVGGTGVGRPEGIADEEARGTGVGCPEEM